MLADAQTKSSLDWDQYKEGAGIADELKRSHEFVLPTPTPSFFSRISPQLSAAGTPRTHINPTQLFIRFSHTHTHTHTHTHVHIYMHTHKRLSNSQIP